jgi:hypothetical protein
VRIAFRPSGGRGEYELAGHQANIRASDLIDRQLDFELTPEITIPGRQAVRRVDGKPRIRLESGATSRHIYLPLAAALLLPKPKREVAATGTGSDFVRDQRYSIMGIDVDVVRSTTSVANLRPTVLWLENASGLVRSVKVPQRMATVQAIWDAARDKTSEVADLVKAHEMAVGAGDHRDIEKAAAAVRKKLATDADVVDDLAAALGANIEATAIGLTTGTVPIKGEEDETDPEEARRRVVAEWRLGASRGASGRGFSQRVRAAYNDRCVLSGSKLPKLPQTLSAGVDGAHILPWARYDLNSVTNGLCLSKMCHWAFDAGVIRIDYDGASAGYRASIPERVTVEAGPGGFDLGYFEELVGPIPDERLPANTSLRPSGTYLARLNEEMYGAS